MKVARTVRSGGKFGDYFKELPIAIQHYNAVSRLGILGRNKYKRMG